MGNRYVYSIYTSVTKAQIFFDFTSCLGNNTTLAVSVVMSGNESGVKYFLFLYC